MPPLVVPSAANVGCDPRGDEGVGCGITIGATTLLYAVGCVISCCGACCGGVSGLAVGSDITRLAIAVVTCVFAGSGSAAIRFLIRSETGPVVCLWSTSV